MQRFRLLRVMPKRLSFCQVVLVWLLRAWAFLFCAHWISSAAWSNRCLAARPLSHQDLTRAAAAVCTWQTVISGFFPPQGLLALGEKQIADRTDCEVPLEAQPATAFVMIQTDFSFVVLKTSLDRPAGEGHAQQRRNRCVGIGIAHEVFDLLGIKNIPCDQEVMRLARKPTLVRGVDQRVLDFPNYRTFSPVLHMPMLPRLVTQGRMILEQILYMHGLAAASDKTRCFSPSASATTTGKG